MKDKILLEILNYIISEYDKDINYNPHITKYGKLSFSLRIYDENDVKIKKSLGEYKIRNGYQSQKRIN